MSVDPFKQLFERKTAETRSARQKSSEYSPPRHFTKDEIESFLNKLKLSIGEIKMNIPIIISPDEYSKESATITMLNFVRDVLTGIKLVPEAREDYFNTVIANFVKAKIEAGSNVGIIAVEAIAGPLSQGNFNTFHTAGVSKNTAQGISSFSEILELSRSKKRYSMLIKFYDNYTLNEILIDKFRDLVAVYVDNVIKSYEILSTSSELFMDDTERVVPPWYYLYSTIYSGEYPSKFWNELGSIFNDGEAIAFAWCLKLELDLDVMFQHNITSEDIVNIIREQTESICYIIYSPIIREDDEEKIVIYIFPDADKTLGIEPMKKLNIDQSGSQLMYLNNVLIPAFNKYLIKGIQNIDYIYPQKISMINLIKDNLPVGRLISSEEFDDLGRLYGANIVNNLYVVKFDENFVRSYGITDVNIVNFLESIDTVKVFQNSKEIINMYKSLSSYHMVVIINILEGIGSSPLKDKKDYITIGDLYRSAMKKVDEYRSNYIRERKEMRKQRNSVFVRLYPDETDLERYSIIRLVETDGIRKINVSKKSTTSKSILIELYKRDDVDPYRTVSDDIYEMTELFGIEAGRITQFNELIRLAKASGFEVNTRHILLISDYITMKGFLTPITPKGMSYHQAGPTAQMAYEQPKKYIKNAALFGIEDTLDNTSALITVNRRIKSGTGIVMVRPDPEREQRLLKEIKKKNVRFTRNETSSIIQKMLDLDEPEQLKPISIRLVNPIVIPDTPDSFPEINLLSEYSLGTLDINILDPVISPELRMVSGEMSQLPINCRPSAETDAVTIESVSSNIPVADVTQVPYVRAEPTVSPLSVIPEVSAAESSEVLDYLF